MSSRPVPRPAQPAPASTVFLLVVFALLNGCDLLTTYLDLQTGLREGNPLMQHLLTSSGFGGLIAYKALMVLVVSCGIAALSRGYPTLARVTLWLCNGLVLLVVLSNLVQYRL